MRAAGVRVLRPEPSGYQCCGAENILSWQEPQLQKINRKKLEPEPQFVISAPAPGGNLISAPQLRLRSTAGYEENLHIESVGVCDLIHAWICRFFRHFAQYFTHSYRF